MPGHPRHQRPDAAGNGYRLCAGDPGKLPIDVIGLNCSTGPEHMREPVSFLGQHATLPVSAIPNAGLPLNVDGQAVYPLEPDPLCRCDARVCDQVQYQCGGGVLWYDPRPPGKAGGESPRPPSPEAAGEGDCPAFLLDHGSGYGPGAASLPDR